MSEQDRAAMIDAARKYEHKWLDADADTRDICEMIADFALAQTADLREQLHVAKEALERTHKVMCDAVRTGHYAMACGEVSAFTEDTLARLDASQNKSLTNNSGGR